MELKDDSDDINTFFFIKYIDTFILFSFKLNKYKIKNLKRCKMYQIRFQQNFINNKNIIIST
jgi:hypothetical protein